MQTTPVLTGIDVLERDGFAVLSNQRVGLITNHTGRTQDGRATADCLHAAPNVTLDALFGPEHGIRGEYDEAIQDGLDERTGLPVYSLYGTRYRPTPEQLNGLETLVYDIQDIGCRFYTYLSTLGHILEAASEHGLRVVVLDRPNPITGEHLEGPVSDPDKGSFTSYHPIPVRHGMTLGELARLIHGEKELRGELTVISCEGWERGEWYDQTGLLWTHPSPNMRSLSAATLYPGVGLLEFTNVSVGRGTDTPFELLGAPYVNSRAFAAAVNAEGLPGVRAIPTEFTPRASIFSGERCGGINLLVTERDTLNSVRLGLTLAILLRELFPQEWQPGNYLRLLANQTCFDSVLAGSPASKLEAGWKSGLAEFEARRARWLIYK